MDTLSWYSFGIPLYVVYVAFEILLARRRSEKVFGFAETISNLTAGLGTLVIGLFVGPWVLRGWDFVHDHIAPFQWPLHGWWRMPAAIVVADFCYYVYHRAGHRFALFWSIHGIHHQHEHLNSSVGFRLEWLADPYAAIFFGLMPLVGIDSTMGFAALAVLSFYALTAHSSVIGRPSWGIFITPTIHGSHHSRDARFGERNYGALLAIWDRLFGTWLEPARGEKLREDAPSITRTHNGVTAQWGLISELAASLAQTPTLRAKARLLLSRPIVRGPSAPLREDSQIGRATTIYVLVHFIALAGFGAWLLVFRGGGMALAETELAETERPLAVQVASALTLIAGLFALGGLLDGRKRALIHERARLILTAVVGVGLAMYSPVVGIALVALALGGLAAAHSLSRSLVVRAAERETQ